MRERAACCKHVSARRYAGEVVNIHEEEAAPLNCDLSNAQQPGGARQARDMSATVHVLPAARKNDDVRDGASSRCGAEQDKVRRETCRGATDDDPHMLRKI